MRWSVGENAGRRWGLNGAARQGGGSRVPAGSRWGSAGSPQWSRSPRSGITRTRQQQLGQRWLASMEPLAKERNHPYPPAAAWPALSRLNGAARQGAESPPVAPETLIPTSLPQ